MLLYLQIRPYLISDGGNVELSEIDGPVVYLKLQGACGSCPSSMTTMTMGIRRRLMEKIPVSCKSLHLMNNHVSHIVHAPCKHCHSYWLQDLAGSLCIHRGCKALILTQLQHTQLCSTCVDAVWQLLVASARPSTSASCLSHSFIAQVTGQSVVQSICRLAINLQAAFLLLHCTKATLNGQLSCCAGDSGS